MRSCWRLPLLLISETDAINVAFFCVCFQVHIPTVKVTSQKRVRGTDDQETVTEDRSRGFGFVQFLCPRDAARVVKVRRKPYYTDTGIQLFAPFKGPIDNENMYMI